ncbi:MAG TPA: glycosyltransferase [Azospirillaceae bacterium]|nr:glycosyltransferase [Azospirillaceae bacterium]
MRPMPAAQVPPFLPHAAFFLHGFEMGGAQRMTLALAGALAAAGARADIVVASGEGPLRDEVPDGVRVVEVGTLGRVLTKRRHRVRLAVPGLASWLRRARPDVLVGAANHAALAAVWAHALADVPGQRLVLRATNPLGREDGGNRLKRLAARRFFPRADALIAVSPAVAADHLSLVPGLAGRVEVIPEPAVDAGFGDRLARDLLTGPAGTPPPGDGPLVLAIGRMVAQKDFTTLLRAVALLRRRHPVRLVLVGDGPERAALEAEAARLGLGGAVLFAGALSNPLPWLRQADCLALSSRWEGLGIVAIEAMAAGVPVAATDCDGTRFVLDGGRYGPLSPPGDPERLADAIEDVLETPLPPDVLRRRAADFSVEGVLPAYLDLFARLGGGAARRVA